MRLDPTYLHKVGKKLTWTDKEKSKKLYQKYNLELIAIMIENGGRGLAANQCGVNIQMFIMKRLDGTMLTCINPELVHTEAPWQLASFRTEEEGCLSFPGEPKMIKRPTNCSVKYRDYAGNYYSADFTNLEARCWLHEYDHCQGITMNQRFNNEIQYS